MNTMANYESERRTLWHLGHLKLLRVTPCGFSGALATAFGTLSEFGALPTCYAKSASSAYASWRHLKHG